MSHVFTTMRRSRIAWGRRFLGAFAAAWLSVVLQPCAMALGVDDPDCPHCPPSEAPPCHTETVPDCTIEDRVTAEPRVTLLKLKDLPVDTPVAAWSLDLAHVMPGATTQCRIEPHHLLHPSGPPLTILHCVYLK